LKITVYNGLIFKLPNHKIELLSKHKKYGWYLPNFGIDLFHSAIVFVFINESGSVMFLGYAEARFWLAVFEEVGKRWSLR